MSGTGKSEATNFLKDQFNFDLFYFGGIVLNEVKKRGLEINNENEKMVREDLRRQHGNGVLAKIASETIAKTDSTILLDGLYSFTEYKILKELYPENFIVVAIHSDKALRYERHRPKEIQPLTKPETRPARLYRDREYSKKGGPIAIADYHILNNGDVSILRQNLLELMDKILTDDNSR